MEVRLTIIGGKADRSEVRLKLPFLIGRCRESDLTIAHPMVSRKHCEVFELQGMVRVRDLGSLNGTKVLGQAVTEAPLRPQDELTVGPLTFRIDYDYPGENTVSVASNQVAAAANGGKQISPAPKPARAIPVAPALDASADLAPATTVAAGLRRPAAPSPVQVAAALAPRAGDSSKATTTAAPMESVAPMMLDDPVDAEIVPEAPAPAAAAPLLFDVPPLADAPAGPVELLPVGPPPSLFPETPPPDWSTWNSPAPDFPQGPAAAQPMAPPAHAPQYVDPASFDFLAAPGGGPQLPGLPPQQEPGQTAQAGHVPKPGQSVQAGQVPKPGQPGPAPEQPSPHDDLDDFLNSLH